MSMHNVTFKIPRQQHFRLPPPVDDDSCYEMLSPLQKFCDYHIFCSPDDLHLHILKDAKENFVINEEEDLV